MKIATHGGPFHADDAVSIAILKTLIPEAEVIRTRDEELLADADLRVDVGGKSNPLSGDFDHHQKGGAGKRDNGVPYASAGLVWDLHGLQFVEAIVGRKAGIEVVESIASAVDVTFIQGVDAVDNGQAPPSEVGLVISGLIAMLNPSFKETVSFDAAFEEAVKVARIALERVVRAAEADITSALEVDRATGDAKDGVMVLSRFVPWVDKRIPEGILYCVFPSHDGETFMVQQVPVEPGSFKGRKPLPKQWAGLNGYKLDAVTGVEGGVFCHNGCFIGGHKTLDGAVKMALKAIED